MNSFLLFFFFLFANPRTPNTPSYIICRQLLYEAIPGIESSHTDIPIEKHTLIVVHASNQFDKEEGTKAAINKTIHDFNSQGLPVIALIHDKGETWYTQLRKFTRTLYSRFGAHQIGKGAKEVTLIGGYYDICYYNAMVDLIKQASDSPQLKINIPMAAVYDINKVTNGVVESQPLINRFNNPLKTSKEKAATARLLKHEGMLMDVMRNFPNCTFEIYMDGKKIALYPAKSKSAPIREIHLQQN